MNRTKLNIMLANPVKHFAEFEQLHESEKELVRNSRRLEISKYHLEYYTKNPNDYWKAEGEQLVKKQIETLTRKINDYFISTQVQNELPL